MSTRTALAALPTRRFLLGPWPWRAVAHVVTTLPVAGFAAGTLAVAGLPLFALFWRTLTTGTPHLAVVILLAAAGTVLFFLGGPLVARQLAIFERKRLRLVDREPCPPGPPPLTLVRYTEASTWWAFGYLCLLATVIPLVTLALLVLTLITVAVAASPFLVGDGEISLGLVQITTLGQALLASGIAVVALVAQLYLYTAVAGLHGALARAMLTRRRDEQLRGELIEVSRSRARLVDAFEAERRRIERDLHDGAQQRLVGLTLRLGLAKLDLPPDSPAAGLVEQAHQEAKQLMAELREFIHGIRPQVLTERGLPAALDELADRAGLPTTIHNGLDGRLPGAVEYTAYFVAAEALTNAAKHSGAGSVSIRVRTERGELVLEVEDDGNGGARPSAGSGLTGLADRVAVLDGRMTLSSPAGGPTVVRVELPCQLSQAHQWRTPSG